MTVQKTWKRDIGGRSVDEEAGRSKAKPNRPRQGVVHRLTLPVLSLQANIPALVRATLLRSDHVAFVSPLQIADDLASGTLVRLPVKLQDVERRIGLTLRRGFSPPPPPVSG